MMKKPVVFLFHVFLILISCSCKLFSLGEGSQLASDDISEATSDFELWAKGIPIGIQITSGTEHLTNYRELFNLEVSGEDESGASMTASHDYLVEKDKSTDTQYEIQTIQSPSPYLNGVDEWATADGFSYYIRDLSSGGQICEKSELPEDVSHYSDVCVTRILLTITPGDLLEKNAQLNGVIADVYTINDISLLFMRSLNKVTGKVWIAQNPAYFLKAEGEIDGVYEFEDRHYTGKATFSYEVKDFDQVKITLPALCAYPPQQMIPMPANAKDVFNHPSLIAFSSSDSLENMKSYYLNELAVQGWKVEEVSSSAFEDILQADITTPQGIHIQIIVKIIPMPEGSRVQIDWQAQ
ncbi:MAG: hypothetical protein JW908_06985 [Anaerolineales bacterium]|nr:hypothetical protein [Anaerolineales bacterium]